MTAIEYGYESYDTYIDEGGIEYDRRYYSNSYGIESEMGVIIGSFLTGVVVLVIGLICLVLGGVIVKKYVIIKQENVDSNESDQ